VFVKEKEKSELGNRMKRCEGQDRNVQCSQSATVDLGGKKKKSKEANELVTITKNTTRLVVSEKMKKN
jgi:hypothetical protein